MIRILLHGACGHMGKVVAESAAQDPDLVIAAGVDAFDDGTRPFPVYENVQAVKEEADVIIDFSTAAAADGLLAAAAEKNLPLVLCTTGLSEAQIALVKETAGKIPVLRSANMSLGINTIEKLVADAAKILAGAGFDMEIEEMPHRRKLDAPSGTALMLADAANEGAGGGYEYVYGRADRRMARPEKEIGISSLRGGSVVGEHKVVFAGPDEMVTVSHSAFSRAIFANGAIAAAKFLAGRENGLYTMQDVVAENAKHV